MLFGKFILVLCVSSSLPSPEQLTAEQKAELEEKLKKVGEFNSNIMLNVDYSNGESDIVKMDSEKTSRARRQAVRHPLSKWANGVNYFFGTDAPDRLKEVFKKATQYWMRYTCINFTENSSAKDKIQVMRDRYGGCSSELGRRGGTQGLWLGDNCMSLRSATHELGHALGLIHTQSRPDRDEAVFVNTENIKGGGKNGDYAKEDKNLVETYGLPYDYGSIMHYDAYSNAIDKKKPAIMPKDELYIRTLGSPSLSYYDKILINKHYGCMENCNATNSIQCANYGFPNPRNCSECICPDGYGGPKCDQRPKGCGKVIRATSSSPRKFSAFVGELKDGQERRECHYWIQAPKGKRIEFKILTVVDWASCGGCFTGGVEIKAKADPRLTGYRYCAPEDKRFTVVSESNLVPVIAYNQGNVFEATIQYRVV